MRRILATIALLASAPGCAQDAGNRLSLVCQGHGQGKDAANADPADEQLRLRIEGDRGRMTLPKAMQPKFHGGDGGWFDVHDLKTGQAEITGLASVTSANRPTFVLNRRSGAISLTGRGGQFAGQCRKDAAS